MKDLVNKTFGTVLFVDDNPGVISELRNKLRKDGIHTKFFENLYNAYSKIEEGLYYDYAVFDSQFPGGRYSVEDLIELSKRKNPEIPIMIYSVEPYIDMKGNKGINSFVEKKIGSDLKVREIFKDYFKLKK